ncbi:unnamed protein product, partial [marine sediment metagenome]
MKFVYSPAYQVDIGTHVFPTQKYYLIYNRLEQEGIINNNNVFEPERPSSEDLLKILNKEYLDDLLNMRLTVRTFPSEMPVQKNIIDAQILCCSGSYLAAKLAREGRIL